jgi:hypothetical protein
MKPTRRIAAALTALTLAVFGLTACSDTEDCDAAGTTTVTVAAVGFVDGKGGGKSGKSKPKKSKVKVHGTDDCEDDD